MSKFNVKQNERFNEFASTGQTLWTGNEQLGKLKYMSLKMWDNHR